MSEPDAHVLRVSIQRRFSDVDALGHVNNVAYVDYLQEARGGILKRMGDIRTDEFAHVVATLEITYVRPILYSREPLIVEMWLTRLGGASYALAYRILDDDGEVAATASTVLACVDPATGKPRRIPDRVREILAQYAAPDL